MLTSDEEIGSLNGTVPLLEKENYRADFVIVNEGREKYDIVVREKGLIILKLSLKGEYAHSAYPWKGKNAVEELMKVILEIKKIFPPAKPAWQPTCSLTVFHGGKETNTIHGYAEAFLNIRFITGKFWSKEAILAKIKKRLPEDIELDDLCAGEVFQIKKTVPYIQLLKQAATEVTGQPMKFSENHGASDARIFSKVNIPTAVLGPSGKFHHTPHEYVEIDSLVTHFNVLKTFINLETKTKAAAAKAVLDESSEPVSQ